MIFKRSDIPGEDIKRGMQMVEKSVLIQRVSCFIGRNEIYLSLTADLPKIRDRFFDVCLTFQNSILALFLKTVDDAV